MIEGFGSVSYSGSLLSGGAEGISENSRVSSLTDRISGSDRKDATDEELMEACKSFETYFLEQVFKEMKKSVHSSDDEGDYMKYFGDTLIQKYAENATESGQIGLAKQLYESMKTSRLQNI